MRQLGENIVWFIKNTHTHAENYRCNRSQLPLMETSKGRISGEEEKNENIIKAKLNQSFTLALDSLPTAGYKWTVEHDSGFLRLDNELYMTSNPEAIGGGK